MTEKVFTWFAYNPKTTSSCQSVDTREETRAESYKFKRNSYIIVNLITVKYQVSQSHSINLLQITFTGFLGGFGMVL